jgi:quercetin 2,3-dioxygenase
MIWIRPARARRHDHRRMCEVWGTFDVDDRAAPFAQGFETLEMLDENRLPPGAELPAAARGAAEIVTYVREGAITCEDSAGHTGIVRAGEFERITASRGLRHTETNASRADWAHMFQMRLHGSDPDAEPDREQKRFSVAERRGLFRIVASPDVRNGALRLHQDAALYSAILERGQHVVHELSPDRVAWLHVVVGEIILGDLVLTTGDGAGLATERAVSLTARQETEVLLLDVAIGHDKHSVRATKDMQS